MKEKNDIYKLIAAFAMLIDHIGLLFLAGSSSLYLPARIIGRLALPIFAYHLSLGYRKTSNLKNYFLRLLIFAVISQFPFIVMRNIIQADFQLNIIFSLLLGLALIYVYDRQKIFLGLLVIVLGIIVPVDYGLYGILLPLTFYLFTKPFKLIFSQFLIIFIVSSLTEAIYFYSQLLSLLAVFLIKFDFKLKVRLNKYFFYLFYPGHLAVLLLIYFISTN